MQGRLNFGCFAVAIQSAQQERDSQHATAAGYGKDAGEQHQGKQARDNEISAFDCFDKRRKEEEQRESDWTIEKRRSPITLDDFSIPFIDHGFSR